MHVQKAVITAAGRDQRTLPLQTLIDRDGVEKSVMRILVEEVLRAGVNEICIVVRPGDQDAYASMVGDHAGRLHFAFQPEPLGHGHAVFCARDFARDEPFLHLVGDHLYVSHSAQGCAEHLIDVASAAACAVSAVQATRESQLPYYGAVGARRVAGKADMYQIETVIEKPTPTEAEQHLFVPGLRSGHYLCFFGMHVLTPLVFDILEQQIRETQSLPPEERQSVTLSAALDELAQREQYLALEKRDARYDVGVKYGLLTAQLAIALSGQERDEVLSTLLELLAQREMSTNGWR
jgi:UTP--glucose-1-phosphate uridylyltransferase